MVSGFLLGILLSLSLKSVEYLWGIFLLALIFISLSLIFAHKKIAIIFLVLTFVLTGYLYTTTKYYNEYLYPLEKTITSDQKIRGVAGRVSSYDGFNINRHSHIISVEKVFVGGKWVRGYGRVKVMTYTKERLPLNSAVIIKVSINSYKNIFGASFYNGVLRSENLSMIRVLEGKSLYGVGTVYNKNSIYIDNNLDRKYLKSSFYDYVFRARNEIKMILGSYLDGEYLDMAISIFIGGRDGVDDGIYALFKRIGISHVLAISGLHLSIIFIMLVTILLLSKLPIKNNNKYFIILLIIVALYLPMTLFRLSLLKTVLLGASIFIVRYFGLARNPLNALFLAAFTLTIIEPFNILSVSFQFGFISVFSILAVAIPLSMIIIKKSSRCFYKIKVLSKKYFYKRKLTRYGNYIFLYLHRRIRNRTFRRFLVNLFDGRLPLRRYIRKIPLFGNAILKLHPIVINFLIFSVSISTSVAIFITPLTLYYYGNITFLTILANIYSSLIIFVMVFSVIMILMFGLFAPIVSEIWGSLFKVSYVFFMYLSQILSKLDFLYIGEIYIGKYTSGLLVFCIFIFYMILSVYLNKKLNDIES